MKIQLDGLAIRSRGERYSAGKEKSNGLAQGIEKELRDESLVRTPSEQKMSGGSHLIFGRKLHKKQEKAKKVLFIWKKME